MANPLDALFEEASKYSKTAPKGWVYCAQHGHQYQVVGRFAPTKVQCRNCERKWPVGQKEPSA